MNKMAWNGISLKAANQIFAEIGLEFEKLEEIGIYSAKTGESAIAQASTLTKTIQLALIEYKKEKN